MYKIKKENIKRAHIIGTILIFISILIIASIIWGNRTFAVKTLPQIIFHLKVPMDGTDTGIYWDWFVWCVPISLIITVISDILFLNINRVFVKLKRENIGIKIKTWIHKKFWIIGVIGLVASLVFAIFNYDVYGFLKNAIQKTDLYDMYYVNPKEVNITFPDKKRNIVHIYLESMESTYTSQSSGGAYNQGGYTEELETLAKDNINFSNTKNIGGSMTVDGTQWTIAAMVAQDTGIPLVLPLNVKKVNNKSPFLPGGYTLGEILEKEGYAQEFLSGSDADFAATSNFFSQHGNYNIVDYKEMVAQGRIPKSYFEGWGFEDEKLFAFAKEDILKLAEGDNPFNMTMVTIDPHTPDGYLSNSCPNKFSKQYENVLACQSSQVYEFVEWLQQQDFYQNTTIVITGDHNSMASKFFENIDSDYVRTPYNVIINAAIKPKKEKERLFTTMDWYPTILAAMGAKIEGDKLGLGTNLFSKEPTLLEQFGYDYLSNEIQKASSFYNKQIVGIKD